ncbi:hypothetical protein Golomagni_05533 [Golovinomyces magnicellulatus]|nr:hypothetical protein Golomagni_05533 [Golovinomyces magnicellulatus]
MATFQIISDLHLETQPSYRFPIKQSAKNLVLLGDIGKICDPGFFPFLEQQLKNYWNVFFLLGNHEPCGSSWATAKKALHDFSERMDKLRSQSTVGRFILLDQTRYDIRCTLFSNVSSAEAAGIASRFIDFRQIQGWTVSDHIKAHESDLQWLNDQVKEIKSNSSNRKIAIFTHYSPTLDPRACDPRHQGSSVSTGFATDLSNEDCWTSPNVSLWAFGHTHYCCDFSDDLGKRVVANQRGYNQKEENAFDVQKTVTITY